MKYASILMIVLALSCWVAAFLMTPITKWPTFMAVERIQSDFIRSDLTQDEKKQLDFHISWIQSNQSGSYSAYKFTLRILAVISALVVIQNIYLIRKQTKHEE